MASEVKAIADSDVVTFREWLTQQPHLPSNVSDLWIKSFIAVAKGSINNAKIKFDNFYKIAHVKLHVFPDYDPLSSENKKINDSICYIHIVGKNSHVCILKLLNKDDPSMGHPKASQLKVYYDYMLQHWDNEVPASTIYIFDLEGYGLSHIKLLDAQYAEAIFSGITNATPSKTVAMHFINCPMEWLLNKILGLMSEKIRKRVRIHASKDMLQHEVPLEDLPEDYGGYREPISVLHVRSVRRVEYYRERFIEERKLRVAEAALRPEDSSAELPTTFKKLEID